MRAVAIPAPGGPEVLEVIDRDVRAPGPGEVRVAVRAAAVNPTDIGLRANGAARISTRRGSPGWTPRASSSPSATASTGSRPATP